MKSSNDNQRVAVIGAGLGGLSAACTLAARGYEVTLFEKNEWLGGKAAVLEQDGFRFDMGPTILTVPSVLRRIFDEAGCDLDQELELRRLDPQWRCFFEDGSTLDLCEDIAEMRQVLADYAPDSRSATGYEEFLDYSARLHEISDRFFFWKSVEGIRDTMDLGSTFKLSTLSDLMALKMGRSVAGTIRSRVPDPRVAQMLDHFTQYVGSSPYNSPAVLCGIAHMQTQEGVWYPIGGTRAVPTALERLARSLGVEVHTGLGVRRILHRQGRATGVETDDGVLRPFAAVVSNMDAVRTYDELVGGGIGKGKDRDSTEPACSGVVLYLGLSERYEHLLHHNFVFSKDPKEEFEWIYEKGEPAPDPTCYVAAPSLTEPGVAPSGGEALYVLVHTPYLRPHHDWSEMLPRYRKTIVDKLRRVGGLEDLEERIVTEAVLTPQDIHERYNVLDGAIYGLASHGLFKGAFKPGNRSREIEGLYLAGGAAHPGPGMPMVLMSGWIAADCVDEDGMVERRRTALGIAS